MPPTTANRRAGSRASVAASALASRFTAAACAARSPLDPRHRHAPHPVARAGSRATTESAGPSRRDTGVSAAAAWNRRPPRTCRTWRESAAAAPHPTRIEYSSGSPGIVWPRRSARGCVPNASGPAASDPRLMRAETRVPPGWIQQSNLDLFDQPAGRRPPRPRTNIAEHAHAADVAPTGAGPLTPGAHVDSRRWRRRDAGGPGGAAAERAALLPVHLR